MCGIAGLVKFNQQTSRIVSDLEVMNKLLLHRGPDGHNIWVDEMDSVGLAHQRLSIIDLSTRATQPMLSLSGNAITFNGEIYNYREIKKSFGSKYNFQSSSDTESIIALYELKGIECLDNLRGMFSFAIWDTKKKCLFCARDRFGIKPFYYYVNDNSFYFASEAKALLPFLPSISTNSEAMAEYLTFQYTIGDKTLFEGVKQLLPGHYLLVENGKVIVKRYWDINYNIDFSHSEKYFKQQLHEIINESIKLHLVSDVEIGSYVSGGVDSSLMHLLAASEMGKPVKSFNGRFTDYNGYDESHFALEATNKSNSELYIANITSSDFSTNIRKVIYHLDFPVAGPGSFPQFMVSKLAAKHLKVVLGGQGGDEIFGGYARYMIAYLEQCIKAAIDGNYKNGNYVVTIESIIPNLGLLREYKPMMKEFWKHGLFDALDERYFRLIDRSTDMSDEINWSQLNKEKVFEDFKEIFNNESNVRKEAYFDKMTHFDFKCLLPALLQVEDRMSMAHGLESRVPLLDHKLVEFAATIPADIKFKNGTLKHLLKTEYSTVLPEAIISRRDKMGFPVPLKEWFDNELKGFILDIFSTMHNKKRDFINTQDVLNNFGTEAKYSRKFWGLLSLELWHQEFHDKEEYFKSLIKK